MIGPTVNESALIKLNKTNRIYEYHGTNTEEKHFIVNSLWSASLLNFLSVNLTCITRRYHSNIADSHMFMLVQNGKNGMNPVCQPITLVCSTGQNLLSIL